MIILRDETFFGYRRGNKVNHPPVPAKINVLTDADGGSVIMISTEKGGRVYFTMDRENTSKVGALLSQIVEDYDSSQFVPRGPVLSGRPARSLEDEDWATSKDDVA